MMIIQDVLVADELFQKQFLCNLSACKGACCWEGDWGAPLEEEERKILEKIYPKVAPYLSEEGKTAIAEKGFSVYYPQAEEYGTPLIKNRACAFMTYTAEGIAKCGIEQAYEAGEIDFKKPISCHLYPIRVSKNEETGFEALNYDEWDICNAACDKGKKEQLPLYKFVQEAIKRKYGASFFDEMEHAAKFLNE